MSAPTTAEELVLMHVRGVGPTGHRAIVGWLREQWLKPDRSIPTDAECEWAANAAINALTKRGVIELYDRDAAWVVTAQDERKQYSFGEAVADLADNFAQAPEWPANSRDKCMLCIEWAREFEKANAGVEWGVSDGREYIEDIDRWFSVKYAEWLAQTPASERVPRNAPNANLIAAAPELLAALEFCANYSKNLQGRILDPQGERPGIAELSEIEEKARAAIAKAKGGAQ